MSRRDDTLQNLMDAGSDIMRSVNRALESGDFQNLSSDITRTVNRVTSQTTSSRVQKNGSANYTYRSSSTTTTQTRSGAQKYSYGMPDTGTAPQTQPYDRYRGQYRTTTSQRVGQPGSYIGSFPQGGRQELTPFVQRRVSRYTGLGKVIGGAMGTVVFGMTAFGLLLGTIFSFETALLVATVIVGGVTAGFVGLLRSGMKQQSLARRFQQYAKAVGTRAYIELKELAGILYIPTEQVRKNLKEMMRAGYLPQAKLDQEETTLMLTSEVYEQYLLTRQNQIDQAQQAAAALAKEQAMSPEEKEVTRIIKEGKRYIRKIREANDAIPDDVMSKKLDRLETIMKRIFHQVERRPDSAPELHRLMDYYLPTTEKLLQAYIELDSQPVAGENISNTKKQIEEVLDTINDAFEKLLDSLFEDVAWDVSSDISVMNTMLRQDGLAGEEIRK